MYIDIKEVNGGYKLKLNGWIDTAEARTFMEELQPMMENADKYIEMDCKNLEYISSLVLRGLMSLQKKCVAKGGRLVLTHVEGEVLNILSLTGFFKLFEVK